MSLRARLLLGFVAIAIVLVGADLVLAANVQKSLVDQIDQRLDGAIGPFTRGFGGRFPGPGPGGNPNATATPDGDANRGFTEFFVAVLAKDGSVLYEQLPNLRDGDPAPKIDAS